MFTKGNSKPPSSPDEISAFLGKETVFEGKMTFQGVFRLDGKFEGEIFDSGTLIIGESAAIKGKIEVNTIIIHGLVEGEVSVKSRTEITSTGRFYGNLSTPVLMVTEGGIFDGQCRMEDIKSREEASHLPLQKEDHLIST